VAWVKSNGSGIVRRPSGLPSIADMLLRCRKRRFGPKAVIRGHRHVESASKSPAQQVVDRQFARPATHQDRHCGPLDSVGQACG
jgi:hypothetical protein